MKEIHDFEKIIPLVMDVESDMQLMYNYVIIEFDPLQNEKTPGGIYAPKKTIDHDVAVEHVPRIGKVVKLPKALFYDKKNHATSMRWKTSVELEVGDQVWINHSTAHDFRFKWKEKHYKIILYEDVVLAKRGEEVIMVNGYILCKPHVVKERALVFERTSIDISQAEIVYIGKPNIEYQDPRRKDPSSLKGGDIIVFDKKQLRKIRYLESDLFLRFDGNPYIVVQGYMVAGVLERS